MNIIEQRMIIYWTIRYFCQVERKIKRRILFLDTNSMPMDIRFPFMFRVDAENLCNSKDLRYYKKFFTEIKGFNNKQNINNSTSIFHTTGGAYYFETESGDYLPEWKLAKKMGVKSSAPDFPEYTNRYLEHNGNTDIFFSPDEIHQLQIFTNNYNELKRNKLESLSLGYKDPYYNVSFKNTEMELNAYVLVFRKIYLKDNQAGGSFPDLCETIKSHEGTALAKLAEDSLTYFKELNSVDIRAVPKKFMLSLGIPCLYQLFQDYPSQITISNLVNLLFYTQYHHNPNPNRIKDLQNLQSFLKRRDADDIIKYIFFKALSSFQYLFLNVGQSFVGKFRTNSFNRKNSLRISNMGMQGATTEDLQRRSKFEKFKRSFAHSIWIEAGRPECGEYAFEEEAERRMLINLGRVRI